MCTRVAYITKPQKIVYIVPTNALAYELERSFKENKCFSEYTIFDKCVSIEDIDESSLNEEKMFFIGTQEKFLEIDKREMAKELGVKCGDSAMRIYRKAIEKVRNNIMNNGGYKND